MIEFQAVAEGERIVRRAYTRQQRHDRILAATIAALTAVYVVGMAVLAFWAARGVLG